MEWLALVFALVGGVLAGGAGVVAYRDRSREDPAGSGLYTIPEHSFAVAMLTISSAGAVALSAIFGALAILTR